MIGDGSYGSGHRDTCRRAAFLFAISLTAVFGCRDPAPLLSADLRPHRFVTSGRLTQDQTPCFSPDGESLLFERRFPEADRSELFVVPADGGPPRPLTSSPLPVRPSRVNWSRRTGVIAFTGLASNGQSGVWLIEPDGSGLREVSADGLSDEVFYPRWYPDGRHMVVVDFAGGEGGVIKRIDTQRRTVEPLTDRREVLAGMPSVSPDGRSIAFAGQHVARRYDPLKNRIWLLDREGLRQLDSGQGRTPAWSPDGEWVAFESDRGSPNGNYALFVVPRQGGRARRLTSHEIHINHPSWSPDGKQIAFSATSDQDPNGRIALIDVPDR